MSWLPSEIPCIPVNADHVKIIETPTEFYHLLLEKSQSATRRIALSSLYLGDGELEKKLIDTIHMNMESNSQLKCTVLLDFLRGTRGTSVEKSSTSVLKKIASKAQVALYHTPALSGFVKRLLPERTNEIVGLQHMKLYIFDDSLIISGANLSDSYFTNRQDRYILFEDCVQLTDYFADIINQSDGSYELHEGCSVHPFTGKREEYVQMMRERLDECVSRLKQRTSETTDEGSDTVVYPILQMGIYGIDQEFTFLKRLLEQKDSSMKITMASGYFNCIDDYTQRIFQKGEYWLDVLTASPKANGFYGARGFSGYVPSMYSSISKRFIDDATLSDNGQKVKLYEYYRDGWTFHAKGIWVQQGKKTATVVGSSNYGYRSVHRDLEAQVLLVTENEELKHRLEEERSRLFHFSSILDHAALRSTDHHVPILITVLARAIRNFF